RRAKGPRNSGTEDCSPIAPSAGVPTGCRRTLAAARRSAIAPAGSRDGLRTRKAAKGYGSARPTHRAQASGSFSADGPSAPPPQAKCTKTAALDPLMRSACSPPLIRDRKIESVNSRSGEVFQQTARMRTDHSTLDIRTSVPTTLPHVNVEYSGSPSHYRADVDGMRVG